MKIFTFFSLLLVVSALFWTLEIGLQQLEQRCQEDIDLSITERIILATKELIYGKPPPDPHWWEPLCDFTGPNVKGKLNLFCNCLLVGVYIIYAQSTWRKQSCEYQTNPRKRSYEDKDDTIKRKRARISRGPPKVRPSRSYKKRPRHQRKRWFDRIIFLPHMPTTEQTVYRAVLLGPVNECFKYVTTLLTATFGRYGVDPKTVKWSHNSDPVGTMVYVSGETYWMKVEVELVAHDGINICIHRVVKVQGLLRFVDSRSYQLTYMGLTCVDQCSTTLYGAGWDL